MLMNQKLLFAGWLLCTTFPLFAQFGPFASAIHLSKDGGTTKEFYNTYKLVGDVNAIGPYNFLGDLGTYNQHDGRLIITGGEVKTFRGNNDNVCNAKLYYRVYPIGNPSGSYTLINLPFFANCNSGVFTDGKGPCSTTDQKWQTVNSNIILSNTLAPGTYTIEFYFEINGKVNSTTECTETAFDSDFGNNYKATFTIAPALPVRLVDFKATNKQGKTLLTWSTLSEENFSRFIVQRSTDGIHFDDIASLNAKGNSSTRINYQYFDNAAKASLNFYRLNQIDIDGKFVYSNIVKVNAVASVVVGLTPNPAKLQVLISGCTAGDLISISDVMGRILFTEKATTNTMSVPIQQLKPGKYFACIKSSTVSSSLSFVKE